MGVLATAPERSALEQTRSRIAILGAVALYAAVLCATLARHEPWADEAQAWLLARDCGIAELLHRLHYEGSPGLWHFLLYALIRLGLPYAGLKVVTGILGAGAGWLLARHSPLPLIVRLTLPFTFFLCYQYAVIARSYSLLPLLLFACAVFYRDGIERLGVFTLLLGLMAAVSVHGLVISVSIWLALHLSLVRGFPRLSEAQRKKLLACAGLYAGALLVAIASAWPATDVIFVTRLNLDRDHFLQVVSKTFVQAFTDYTAASLAVIALSAPLLWRGGGWKMFLPAGILLSTVNAVVYFQVWHLGLLFLAWVFAIWISADRARPGPAFWLSFGVVAAFQCYWTVESVRYDWSHPYSGSLEAARYLKESGIAERGPFAIGYACVGIQPYFARNIFRNVNGGVPSAFWDWSSGNHVNEDSGLLALKRPEYVMVGYKGAFERDLWTGQVTGSGYELRRHFEGNLFWRDRALEPESYDLYQRRVAVWVKADR